MKYALIFVFIFTLGCFHTAYDQKINETYYLWAVDVKEQMTFGFEHKKYGRIGLVGATVFEYFYDGQYIFVKQRHGRYTRKYFEGVRYYLVPAKLNKDQRPDDFLVGPLNKQEFENKIKSLGYATDIKFKTVIDNCGWLGLFCKP